MRYIIKKIERFWTVFGIDENGEYVFDYRFETKREANLFVKRAEYRARQ